MKQLLLLFTLLFTSLHADIIEDYLNQEIALERDVNTRENNTTELEIRLTSENENFTLFFLDYVAAVDTGKIKEFKPYRSEMFKLKRRMKTNSSLHNNYAVYRDELRMASLMLKQNIRDTLFKIYDAAKDQEYMTFEDALQNIIIERHKIEPNLNLSKYEFVRKVKELDPLTQSILDNLQEYIALQDIHNNLSAIVIENSRKIYKLVAIAGYGVVSFAVQVEESALAKQLTPILEPLYLSSSKVIYIAIILLFASLSRYLIVLAHRRLFRWFSGNDEDAQYIVEKSKGPFNTLMLVVASELIFMVYSGLSDVAWVFTSFNIVYVLLFVFLTYRMANAFAVIKMEQMSHSKHVRNEVVNLGLKLMNVVLGLFALIFILKLLGVNLTALMSGLGIGGVAVAFAAKDTLANFFGSVSILMSDLFEQGDWIAVNGMEGNVVEIGLRATTIRTFDNALIAIPNFKLADNGIKNWSHRKMGRRIKMTIGVTYESDMDDVKAALVEIREMLHNHPLLMGEKTEFMSNERQVKLVSKEDLKGIKRQIMVYLDGFGPSSIDILVYCFSRSVVWNHWHEAKEDVMFEIADILKQNNLEFAYPTMMIHQAKESEVADVIE